MNALAFYLLSVLASLSTVGSQSNLGNAINSPECRLWVDSVYNSMSENDRIAQLMMVNCPSNQGANSRSAVKTMVEKYHVGGIFFSKGKAAEFAELTNYAQSLSPVPLLMGIDGEWGPAMRVTDAPEFPFNMSLGAISDPTLLYDYGLETARECRALGIMVDFAPVVDVNSNPANPVIGYRSFGEDPRRVADLARAYSLGLEAGGVMAVAKHFPGHGDTDSDSHKTLPTVTHDRARLDSVDLLPFREYIAANLSGVMVGHLSVPALDPSKRPASMSRKITTDFLKGTLGFKGLVFSDGLGMKGASTGENVCVAALAAGNDILVGPPSVARDIEAVKSAIASGRLSWSVIEASCKKMLAYKYALGLDKRPAEIDVTKIVARLNAPEAQTVMQRLADAAVTVLRDEHHILPIADLAHSKIAVVNIGAPADNTFSEYCRRYGKCDVYTASGAISGSTLNAIRAHDVVIAAVYDDKSGAQSALASLKGVKGLVPVFFLNPYKMGKFKGSLANAAALVIAYDKVAACQKAAAMALYGGIDVQGRLPVNVAGVARLGDGINIKKTRLGYTTPGAKGMKEDITTKIDDLVEKAMKSGAFPGAQVVVVKGGDIVVDRCYGKTTKGGDPVTWETLYDLASVSKAVGTLPGVMKAYDLGLFELDTPASTYVPGLNTPMKKDITPRMLLHHETGMPAALNMFKVMMDTATYTGPIISGSKDAKHSILIQKGAYGHNDAKMRTDIVSDEWSEEFSLPIAKGMWGSKATYDTIMATIYRQDVNPSRTFRYSCLNFCLLMDLEQHVTGMSHDTFVTDSIWAPLGANTFCYRAAESYPLSQIAATEQDNYLRKQHVQGYVHDELAAFSGGLQGNAGVFGTAGDIAKLCQMWINGGEYGDARVLSKETVTLFTTDKSPTCRRGLGFDKPDKKNPDNSPVSDVVSAATYGHTGFTGTCFWVDPKEDLVFIFLSNRVDPTRDNAAWSKSSVRSAILRLLYDK